MPTSSISPDTASSSPSQSPTHSFDELQFADGSYRPSASQIGEWLKGMSDAELNGLNDQAADMFYRKGVTFTVYSDANNIERMIPFDIIPRIIDLQEWRTIEAGCQQRIKALNHFLHDIYHGRNIIQEGIVPAEFVYASGCYEPWMMNIELDKPIYSHISGIDLIRDSEGQYRVLEDNLRTPSGVSYMLESRVISETLLGDVYRGQSVLPVADYPARLKTCLSHSTHKYDPQIVILTPGRFNSAYYEHAFLAHEMNVPLVSGFDLIVEDNKVYIQGVRGKVQVDVIYRRIDDPFLDPLAFRSDSILGVSGLMSAYRAGNVVIVNAPGTGVADDKSIYPYVPAMINYYLNETPILPNVETYQCRNSDELAYVMDNLQDLVVKETQGSGGYGMLIGPSATPDEIEAYRKRVLANPNGFIAQPTISLSTNPTAVSSGIAPRHIDLRPFVLSHGNGEVDIVPGGLTRVAMTEGSLVVNSSQGGGVKDTWVVDTSASPEPQVSSQQLPLSVLQQQRQLLGNIACENLDDAPLILLLSTASNLVWLGRYSERLRHYEELIEGLVNSRFDEDDVRQIVWQLGLSIEPTHEALFAELGGNKVPDTIAHIETNVQDVKGVIGKDTAELYNLIKRLANTGTYRAASLQLNACNAAMEQESEIVKRFWELGRHFEALSRTIMMQEAWLSEAQQLKDCVQQLPENTRWRDLERLTNQLLKSQNVQDFAQLSDEFQSILQQGV